MSYIHLSFILFFLVSCSKTKDEELSGAVDVAQTYLSENKCQDAIDVLEDVDGNADPIYLQVLASAYSCRGGFSELNFIANDIPALDTSSNASLFKSLSILSTSDETETDSSSYTDLKTALNLLLDSAGTQPSHTARVSTFGSRKASDLSIQILFLSIAQLGKFLNHYGNVDSTGLKGLGPTGTNSCFFNYLDGDAQNTITAYAASNGCNSFVDGHPDLDLNTQAGQTRACEGLVLFNNLIDSLSSLDLSDSETISSLSGISSIIEALKDDAVTANPSLSTLLTTTSLTTCEDLLLDSEEIDNMQLVYALVFELGLE